MPLKTEKGSISIKSKAPVIKAKIRNEFDREQRSKDIFEERKHKRSERTVYRDKDFDKRFGNIVEEAKALWYKKVDEFINKNGEQGCFHTLGAGIYVFHLPPRHRIPKVKQILQPPGAAYAKGLHYSHIAEEVVKFMCSKGVDCFYDPGIDD